MKPYDLMKKLNISVMPTNGMLRLIAFPEDLEVETAADLLKWLRENPKRSVTLVNVGLGDREK